MRSLFLMLAGVVALAVAAPLPAAAANAPITMPHFEWHFANTAVNNPASDYGTNNRGAVDYSTYVSLTFTNVSKKTITAITFRFFYYDASGNPVFYKTGKVTGSFAPGTTNAPRYTAINHIVTLQSTDPSSPAWHFKNSLGKGLTKISVGLLSAQFADGTQFP